MRTLRDFCCPTCNTIQERFIGDQVVEVDCACGGIAQRVIGMPKILLDGTDASFPGAYDRWARIREDRARQNAKKSYVGE